MLRWIGGRKVERAEKWVSLMPDDCKYYWGFVYGCLGGESFKSEWGHGRYKEMWNS